MCVNFHFIQSDQNNRSIKWGFPLFSTRKRKIVVESEADWTLPIPMLESHHSLIAFIRVFCVWKMFTRAEINGNKFGRKFSLANYRRDNVWACSTLWTRKDNSMRHAQTDCAQMPCPSDVWNKSCTYQSSIRGRWPMSMVRPSLPMAVASISSVSSQSDPYHPHDPPCCACVSSVFSSSHRWPHRMNHSRMRNWMWRRVSLRRCNQYCCCCCWPSHAILWQNSWAYNRGRLNCVLVLVQIRPTKGYCFSQRAVPWTTSNHPMMTMMMWLTPIASKIA